MSDIWLIEYESIFDRFVINCHTHGEEEAIDRLRDELRRLGLEQGEIDAHVSSVVH